MFDQNSQGMYIVTDGPHPDRARHFETYEEAVTYWNSLPGEETAERNSFAEDNTVCRIKRYPYPPRGYFTPYWYTHTLIVPLAMVAADGTIRLAGKWYEVGNKEKEHFGRKHGFPVEVVRYFK